MAGYDPSRYEPTVENGQVFMQEAAATRVAYEHESDHDRKILLGESVTELQRKARYCLTKAGVQVQPLNSSEVSSPQAA